MPLSMQQYYLGKIAEEASEVAQRALKAQQFGTGEIQAGQGLTNAERMKLEVLDLLVWLARLDDLTGDEPLTEADVERHAKLIHTKQQDMLELSRKCGMVRR